MTQDNRLWVLMSRRLSGEATPAEVEELTLLLESSPQKQYLYGLLHSWFTDLPSTASGQPVEDPGFEERFFRILTRPDPITTPRPARRRLLYITFVAASII